MKKAFPILLFVAACALCHAAEGPSLRLRLIPDRPVYRAGERVDCRLSLVLGDDALELAGGGFNVSGLPQATPGVVDATEFEPAAREGDEASAWVQRLTFLAPTEIPLAPELSGTVRRIQQSHGFFRQYSMEGFRAVAEARTLRIEPVPEAGKPDSFTGCVGSFAFRASFEPDGARARAAAKADEPLRAAPGDLLILRWTLEGQGAGLLQTAPSWAPGTGFKVYPPRIEEREDGRVSVSQTVIPTATNIVEAADFAVSWFDPDSGKYRTESAGPWPLAVAERPADDPEPAEGPGADPSAPESGPAAQPSARPAYIAPSSSSRRLFSVPEGSSFRVRETTADGAWSRVLLPDGSSAWIQTPKPTR